MSKIKNSLLAMVAAAATMGATSASAAHFEVWNGSSWSTNGTITLSGPTTASFLANSLPCANASFTLQVTGGVATVQSASFSDPVNAACANIISRGLPWDVTITAGSGSTWTIQVGRLPTSTTTNAGGVNVFIPAPLNANCPNAAGRATVDGATFVNGTTTTAASFSFNDTLGPCAVKSNPTLFSVGAPNASVQIVP